MVHHDGRRGADLHTTKYRVNTREFMAQIRKLGRPATSTARSSSAKRRRCRCLQVVKAGLTQVNRGEEAMIASMEERMSEVMPELEKRIGSLWSLRQHRDPHRSARHHLGPHPVVRGRRYPRSPDSARRVLASGISEAMYNTALGLGIAVICMIFHLMLHAQQKRIKQDMERSTMKLENLLTILAGAPSNARLTPMAASSLRRSAIHSQAHQDPRAGSVRGARASSTSSRSSTSS